MSESKIKAHFISRWGEEGVLLEADYSQLEVVVLAVLSGDKQLKEDIINGVDIHRENAADLFGTIPEEVSSDERKLAKGFSFLMQYGGGAKKMSETFGVPVELATRFIDNYYRKYNGVKAWQDRNISSVEKSSVTTTGHTAGGNPQHEAFLTGPTGRLYKFVDQDNPFYGKSSSFRRTSTPTSFSPTKIKNYPVQGFATGDIVPMVVGSLFRRIQKLGLEEYALLINTVHDSIMLDVHTSVVYTVVREVKRVMESAPQMLSTIFSYDEFDLPLKVEIKTGPNWDNLEVIKDV